MHNIRQVSDTMEQVYLVSMQYGKDQHVLWTSYGRICTELNGQFIKWDKITDCLDDDQAMKNSE